MASECPEWPPKRLQRPVGTLRSHFWHFRRNRFLRFFLKIFRFSRFSWYPWCSMCCAFLVVIGPKMHRSVQIFFSFEQVLHFLCWNLGIWFGTHSCGFCGCLKPAKFFDLWPISASLVSTKNRLFGLWPARSDPELARKYPDRSRSFFVRTSTLFPP